jgi:hypothetical protein
MTEDFAVKDFMQSLGLNAIGDLDRIEAQMVAALPPVQCDLTHTFCPGMYVRQIFMPAGSLITSKIHRTEHPYVISMGRVSVWTAEDGVQHLSAPHTGITSPGTRRLLFIWTDTVWTTFHATELTSVDEIEAHILEPYINPLLGKDTGECLLLPQA